MLAQRARMGVGLVAAGNSTIVRLVGRVDVTVLLAIAAVREPPLAAGVFALERFLSWKKKTGINDFVIEPVNSVRACRKAIIESRFHQKRSFTGRSLLLHADLLFENANTFFAIVTRVPV